MMERAQHLLLPVLLLLLSSAAVAYKTFQDRVPNGNLVPHPCWPKYVWHGVGHKNLDGGGDRNPFGLDFARNGYKWNECLCRQDSDSDGLTNGEELGDPDCVWQDGAIPSRRSTSHPGICEPLDDPKCQELNNWDMCTAPKFECKHLNTTQDLRHVDIKLPSDSEVPATETNYRCKVFAVPDDDEYHLIAYEPLIDNANVAHHIVFYGCKDSSLPVDAPPFECGMAPDSCSQLISVWTVGFLGQCFDESYGFRLGQRGFKRVMMSIHWDNPELKSGYTDGSGFRLYYTTQLRPNDGGMLTIGQQLLGIPPGEDRVEVTATCDETCTNELASPIFITSGIFHMHWLGKSGYVTHSRNGTELTQLISDDVYSYDHPTLHIYDNPIEFMPGDTLDILCVYSSKYKGKLTKFGGGTEDEMCYTFITYYPLLPDFYYCTNEGTGQYCQTYRPSEVSEEVGDCDIDNFWSEELPNLAAQLSELCDPDSCLPDCKGAIVKARESLCLQPWTAQIIEPLVTEDFREAIHLLHTCDSELYELGSENYTPKTDNKNRFEEVDTESCMFDVGGASVVLWNCKTLLLAVACVFFLY